MYGKLRNGLFAFVLLLVQSGVIAHQLDFKAHQSGEPCQICLHTAHLGDAAVDTGASFAAAAIPDTPLFTGPVLHVPSLIFVYLSRGPPASNLV